MRNVNTPVPIDDFLTANAKARAARPRDTAVEVDSGDRQRASALVRRMERVLRDVGLDTILPADWIRPTIDGLWFHKLDLQQAERLVLAIEDLARDYRPEITTPGPDQGQLF